MFDILLNCKFGIYIYVQSLYILCVFTKFSHLLANSKNLTYHHYFYQKEASSSAYPYLLRPCSTVSMRRASSSPTITCVDADKVELALTLT